MKQKLLSLAALFVVAVTSAQETEQPKQMIMFIGDGFGTSAKVAARMALGQGTEGKRFTDDAGFHILALDKLDYQGSLTTHSRNSWITDSGPGASAYAAGVSGKLDNESISFNVGENESVETILEKAKKAGYAVGLVTTTRITHATPATFGSHIWFRDLEDYIASQYISSTEEQYEAIYNDPNSLIAPYDENRDWVLPEPKLNVEIDVLLGGGARHFLPKDYVQNVVDASGNQILDGNGNPVTMVGKRTDKVNLIDIATSRGYVNVNSRDALLNIDLTQFTAENNTKLIGLFNASHNNYEQDRQLNASWEPSLPEMTQIAIQVLKAKGGSKGFFLLVEGGRIDHLEHANSGGITVITGGSGSNVYTVDSDKQSYVGGGEAIYGVTPTTPRQTDIYGSDYLIKEVLSFDYSIAQGRKLLDEGNTKTLIFSSSDHECGGTAIVGLHDSADAQNNGTHVRTYALGPRQNGVGASSSGPATATTVANPAGAMRGDIDFGTSSPNGWYPNYTTYVFQNRAEELWPAVAADGRRIVVAYASNPLTNGNGAAAGGTPGNHTPMDVFVGAQDNVGGAYAGQISGIGQMDNTFLNHIMEQFLLEDTLGTGNAGRVSANHITLFPNPSASQVTLSIELNRASPISVEVYDMGGRKVNQFDNIANSKSFSYTMDTSNYTKGVYIVNVKTNQGQFSKKLIVKQ
jgi:alkaline phosphatase